MLNLDQITVDIAGVTVLRRISVTLQAGQTYAVVGQIGRAHV